MGNMKDEAISMEGHKLIASIGVSGPVLTKKTFQIESIQIDFFISRLEV